MPTLQSVSYGTAARSGADHRGGAGRALLVASVGPLVIGYLGLAALLALVTATAPGADVSTAGVLAAAAPAWLAAYHVPVDIAGHELGMLPLLPTVLMMLLVARTAGNTARRLDLYTPRSAVKVICAIGFTHAVFGAVLALMCSGAQVGASAVIAFFVAGVFGALAATLGTAGPCGMGAAILDRADPATAAGLRAGGLAVAGLIGVGAAVFALGSLASWSTAVRLFQVTAPGAGGGLGMFLLSVAYLPNALIGTLSFVAGPGFGIGSASVAQWTFHAGPVPAMPLLAPLPVVEAYWWIFLMLLPAGVGVLVGFACRRFTEQRGARVRAVLLAALVAAVSWLVLAALAGGALAGGPFDPVTVPAGLLAASVFLFVAVFGVSTVWLAGRDRGGLMSFDDDEYVEVNGDNEVDDTEVYDGEADPDEPVEDEPAEPDVSEFESEFSEPEGEPLFDIETEGLFESPEFEVPEYEGEPIPEREQPERE